MKLDVVTGFLGAGKTTLIRRLLPAYRGAGLSVALIENEFGQVGVDGTLLRREGLEIYELAQGCICCTVKGDFIETILRIRETLNPDRILLEPSGIFAVEELFAILRLPRVAQCITLNAILSVVDAQNYLAVRAKYGWFFRGQTKFASAFVVSKAQLVEPEALLAVTEGLAQGSAGAPVIARDWAEVTDAEWLGLLDGSASLPAPAARRRGRHGLAAVGFPGSGDWTRERLAERLAELGRGDYGEVVRAKALLRLPEGNRALQWVMGSWELEPAPGDEPCWAFIGENLDEEALKRDFQ